MYVCMEVCFMYGSLSGHYITKTNKHVHTYIHFINRCNVSIISSRSCLCFEAATSSKTSRLPTGRMYVFIYVCMYEHMYVVEVLEYAVSV